MRVFLDTSVLVAAFYEDHEHHLHSFRLLIRQTPKTGAIAAHSLAEVYAVLTGMPGKHRAAAEEVLLYFESIRERMAVVELSAEQYGEALQAAAAAGVLGGGVYDTLLAHAAKTAKAAAIYTWNAKHFTRMGGKIAERVRTPESA